MSENRARFNSVNGKRLVLIVDDAPINRQILGATLEADYELIYAEDGEEALAQVRSNSELLSCVLLDLVMPKLPGQEVLRALKADPATQSIPIIVASANQAQEIECLDLGASDFIQKPYPDAGVILARIRRTIELSEDRQIILSTERDPLTGLYNKEYFYSYADQYDQHHKDVEMDAIVLDINHFSILNERYGRSHADDVLRRVGEKTREMVHDSDGIVCRRSADTFLIYCPHRGDYKAILDNASAEFVSMQNANHRVRLRMGVYPRVDKSLDIERRFDRAKMAADTVRNSYTRNIGIYDDSLRKSELYFERLVDDFPTAIEQGQFEVYYQPKFAIQPEEPMLESAEALVRWRHPELGMISPGVFVPLFEDNGLIQTLDNYVWCEVARQISEWGQKYGYCMPVSVNVSRIDMYDPNIVHTLLSLMEEHALGESDLHLEVTESAYAEEPEQIVETVRRLRGIGLRIEMDDFGTGYSSLNMLSALPIDALKLDIGLVRSAFTEGNDTHLLEVIMQIAEHLGVPVIAEGVETQEQLDALRAMGCDIVQGYYFSEAVPASEFEHFLEESDGARIVQAARTQASRNAAALQRKQSASPSSRSSFLNRLPSIPLRTASLVSVIIAFVAAIALFTADSLVMSGFLDMQKADERYIGAQLAATNLEMGSDHLTDCVRSFVATGERRYLDEFFEEAQVTRQRDKAVDSLEELLGGVDNEPHRHLSEALTFSNELMGYEYHAMKLVVEAGSYDTASIPDVVMSVELSPEERAMNAEQKRARASELVFGQTYADYKTQIKALAAQCTDEVIAFSQTERQQAEERMNVLFAWQTGLTILFFAIVLGIVAFLNLWVQRPLTRMVTLMQAKQTVPPTGAQELRFVTETYNAIFEENRRTNERLTYGSMHDALTGLFNRKAYDIMREEMDMSNTALLLIDVDKFKSINDTHGHDVGDLLLKHVAEVLHYSFRSTDLVFRLGGDEFVVIMAGVNSSIREQVKEKIDQANVMLQKPKGDLPPTSLSVGVAFADRENPEGDIFKDADTALYRVKEAGRCGCIIY